MAWLIGIAGGTGAGKSTVAHAIIEHFGGICIDIDSYYIDRSRLHPETRSRLNYDEPTAIDAALLLEHLRKLPAGQAIPKPQYSFQSHTRIATEIVAPAPVVLVDGLFALSWENIRALLDLKIFVDTPADLRLARRIRRDITERGRTVDSVLTQYLNTVRPMHERYVEPTRAYADLVVTNDGAVQDCVGQVIASVRDLVTRPGPTLAHAPAAKGLGG